MKIKVKFVAERETRNEQGTIAFELVKDAIPAFDLEGKRIAVTDFGKNISNQLYMANLPQSVNDVIEFRKFLVSLHDNAGDEIEMDEEYIPVIIDIVNRNQSVVVAAAAKEFFDKALMAAKNKESKIKK